MKTQLTVLKLTAIALFLSVATTLGWGDVAECGWFDGCSSSSYLPHSYSCFVADDGDCWTVMRRYCGSSGQWKYWSYDSGNMHCGPTACNVPGYCEPN